MLKDPPFQSSNFIRSQGSMPTEGCLEGNHLLAFCPAPLKRTSLARTSASLKSTSRPPCLTHFPRTLVQATMAESKVGQLTAPPLATRLSPVQSRAVPNMPNWRYAGPLFDETSPTPLPAVIYFALTAEQSLELPPFNEFVRFILVGGDAEAAVEGSVAVNDGHAPLRVFSVTLPYHGDMPMNETALEKWAELYSSGADVVSFFTRKVSAGLDELIAQGHIDQSRVYAAGLSRGGLLAAHLALVNQHVNTVLGFSPVTKLADLKEFTHVASTSAAVTKKLDEASLLSERCVDGLSRCSVRVYSGNTDTRVGTRNCFELMAALADRARSRNVRSPPHEYIMFCSLGREGHGTSSDVFCVGARWLLRRAGLRA